MVTQQSKALALVGQLGWDYKESGTDNIAVRVCPYCYNENYKFYVGVSGDKDGLHDCKVCGKQGNFYALKQCTGVEVQNVASMKDAAAPKGAPAPLPDFAQLHKNLMDNEAFGDVLDYLISARGFSLDTIQRLKLGAEHFNGKTWYVIPYLDATGKGVFFKSRTVPPEEKDFRGPSGRVAPLYNDSILQPGIEEIVMCEGEADTIALLNAGYPYALGIPGSTSKKAEWIAKLDSIKPKKVYLCYDVDKAGQTGAKDMAARIGLDLCYNIVLPEFAKEDGTPGKDLNEWLRVGNTLDDFIKLMGQAKPYDVEGVQNVGELLEELKETIETVGLQPKYTTQYPDLNAKVGGFEDGDVVGVLAEGKIGKGQPLHSKLRTPYGWIRMGAAKVGDELASVDGKVSTVTGVFPQGVKDVYLVTFSDGRTTECDDSHLWHITPVNNGKNGSRVVNTLDLKKLVDTTKDRYYVPLCNGRFGNDRKHSIDPWLLGVLLGDGSITESTPAIHKEHPFVRTEVGRIVSERSYVTTDKGTGFSIVSAVGNGPNYFTQALKKLQLHGADCYSKFIPLEYMESSYDNRIRLLQGLMDTDGTAATTGATSYSTTSKQLAYQVQELVRSLGGNSTVSSRVPTYKYKGEKKKGQIAYKVSVMLENRERIFTLPEKKERAKGRATKKQNRLTIELVEYVGKMETQCISVSHPSKLYITDNYVVTHNTTFAMNLLDYWSLQGYDTFLYCDEMRPVRVVRKWVAMKTRTDDGDITVNVVNKAIEMAGKMPGDILFGHTMNGNVDTVMDTIRQAVRRYGVKVVCYDNLQLLVKDVHHTAQETSIISKKFKALAMELNILIILIVQPHRVAEGQIVSARNASGSAAIEKDVDFMLCLHRNRVAANMKAHEFTGVMTTDTNFEPQLMVKVDLARFAPGGICTLWMEGAKSYVRNFNDDEVLEAAKKPDFIPIEV